MSVNNRKKLDIKLMSIVFLMILTFKAIAINQDTRPYELAESNEKLNVCYKQLFKRLNSRDQINLRKAQRQWIVFRDLDCKWAFGSQNIDCLIDRTDTRIKELSDSIIFHPTQYELKNEKKCNKTNRDS